VSMVTPLRASCTRPRNVLVPAVLIPVCWFRSRRCLRPRDPCAIPP
jgi:hypothetical protein